MKTVPKQKTSAARNVAIAIGGGDGLGALVMFAMWAGQLAWYILVAVAVAGAMWEVLTRLREHSYHLPRTLMIIGGQLMVWSSWPLETEGLIAFYVIAVLALMFGRLFHNGRHRPPINYLRDTAVGVFVLTWIPMFGSFAAMLSATSQGASSILVFMLCVVASDTGGYITGVMFGSHPMAPAVSPKKSWEGFAGSIIFGMVTGALSIHFLLEREAWAGVIMGLGLVVCATLGDLVESQFKRELGIKDMSNILPGHGGLMDRLDGMLPAAMVTWLAISFLGV